MKIDINGGIELKKLLVLVFICLAAVSCSNNENESDAYGNFEATEITVSAEADGKLLLFTVDEGKVIEEGQIVGMIDTTQLYLRRQQLEAQKYAITSKIDNIFSQIAVLQEQLDNANNDKKRIEFLFKDGAATQKEMDDIKSRIAIITKQIESIETQNQTVVKEVRTIEAQIAQVNDLLSKCVIHNPVKGTVLNKYIERFELANMGKPLYKIADLTTMTLRAYFTGEQLPNLELDQKVKVLIDKDKLSYTTLDGVVSWISPKAEFTPKNIQTKEERATMVYDVKVLVKNDGKIKIGMPGEVRFIYKDK